MSVVLQSSGGGSVTLQEPSTASNRTLTLPDVTATVLTNSSGVLDIGSGQVYKDASGNVGIGTTSPGQRLEISNSSTNTTFGTGSNAGNQLLVRNSGTTTNAFSRLDFAGSNNNVTASIGAMFTDYNNGATNIVFGTQNASSVFAERMRIKADGEVLIAGTTDQGAYNLQVGGTGVWGAGAYTNGSDARIKEEIAPIGTCLNIVQQLNPVTFRYKEDWSKDQSTQAGFVAQELKEVLANEVYLDGVVQEGPEYMSVAYQALIPVLVKAIQELKSENDGLKARIEALEAK